MHFFYVTLSRISPTEELFASGDSAPYFLNLEVSSSDVFGEVRFREYATPRAVVPAAADPIARRHQFSTVVVPEVLADAGSRNLGNGMMTLAKAALLAATEGYALVVFSFLFERSLAPKYTAFQLGVVPYNVGRYASFELHWLHGHDAWACRTSGGCLYVGKHEGVHVV